MALDTEDIDNLILLSDGAPGSGKDVGVDAILDAMRRTNRFRRIEIDTIGIRVNGEAERPVEEPARQIRGRSAVLRRPSTRGAAVSRPSSA